MKSLLLFFFLIIFTINVLASSEENVITTSSSLRAELETILTPLETRLDVAREYYGKNHDT